MKYTIELEYEMVDRIIIQELQSTYKDMKRDLKNRDEGTLAIWDHDPAKDKKMIKKHMEAIELILEFYGASTK
jgi:hypothetical protein